MSGPATLRWSATDPDGDAVGVLIEYRQPGDPDWNLAGEYGEDESADPIPSGDEWREGRWVWETATLVEGEYELRAVATDRAANARGEGFRTEAATRLTVVVGIIFFVNSVILYHLLK